MKRFRTLFVCLLVFGWTAAPFLPQAAADEGKQSVQDAINNAGFGSDNANPNQDLARARDPHGKADSSTPASTNYVGVEGGYSNVIYMNTPNYKVNFKISEDHPPLPVPESQKHYEYNYLNSFKHQQGNVVIGPPSAASDGLVHNPSEPWPYGGVQVPGSSIYKYSGDYWGDCLGPNCVDHGAFRQPIGSWTQFLPAREMRRNDLIGFVGFSDTIPQLSQQLGGRVIQLTGDRQ